MEDIYIYKNVFDNIYRNAKKNKSSSSIVYLDEKRHKVHLDKNDELYIKINKVRHNIKLKKPNKHPCAVIINEWFKDDSPFLAKFCYLGYFAFIPLIKYGTNGRKIHNDYDEYWAKYQKYYNN